MPFDTNYTWSGDAAWLGPDYITTTNGAVYPNTIMSGVDTVYTLVDNSTVTLGDDATVGHYNHWDENWELGTIDPDDGVLLETTNDIRSRNLIPLFPRMRYRVSAPEETSFVISAYDANRNFITNLKFDLTTRTFTTTENTSYIRFATDSNYGGIYRHDIAIWIASDDPLRYSAWSDTASASFTLRPNVVDLNRLFGESYVGLSNLQELSELQALFGNAYQTIPYSEGIPVNDGPGYCQPLEPKEPEEELNFDDILEQWK